MLARFLTELIGTDSFDMRNTAGWVDQYGVDILTQNVGASHVITLRINGVVKDTFTATPNAAGPYWHDITPLLVANAAVLRVTLQITRTGSNSWWQQAGLFATPPIYCSGAVGSKDGATAGTTAYGCHLQFIPGSYSPDWDVLAFGGAGAFLRTPLPRRPETIGQQALAEPRTNVDQQPSDFTARNGLEVLADGFHRPAADHLGGRLEDMPMPLDEGHQPFFAAQFFELLEVGIGVVEECGEVHFGIAPPTPMTNVSVPKVAANHQPVHESVHEPTHGRVRHKDPGGKFVIPEEFKTKLRPTVRG
jgi:hypothetical protein